MSTSASISASAPQSPSRFFRATCDPTEKTKIDTEQVPWFADQQKDEEHVANKPSNQDFLHIPNKLFDNDIGLWNLETEYPFRNITICMQERDRIDKPLGSFPDPVELSLWLESVTQRLE
ncbi:unnamed protein product, partial [Fusarium langsethiae]